jgi:hypothetical protein
LCGKIQQHLPRGFATIHDALDTFDVEKAERVATLRGQVPVEVAGGHWFESSAAHHIDLLFINGVQWKKGAYLLTKGELDEWRRLR